ncbi:MAG: DUF4097 domain-containing protein, partial [Muribaculaceae bacterium]|nr:DUF4097 domain-containing protein [Muribaculaceae bacterium]
SAAKSAQIKMTAGNCTFENCVFNNADIKMTAGEMYLSFCELIGENNLKMTAGDLYMDLVGNRSDYEIAVDKTAGSLYIDGDSFGRGDYEYSATTVVVTEQVVTGQSEVSVQEKNPQNGENASNSLDVQITAGECNIHFTPPDEAAIELGFAPEYE